jgi:putative transposase
MKGIKRTWSIEEKISILKDIKKTGVVEGCRKHGIYATTYYDWKKKYEEKGADGLVPRYGRKEAGELKKVKKENERLKKLLAEKELELSIQGELLKKKIAQWKSAKK